MNTEFYLSYFDILIQYDAGWEDQHINCVQSTGDNFRDNTVGIERCICFI